MLRTPALLPAAGWPAQTATTKPPDWRWRATMLRDVRGKQELPVTYPPRLEVEEYDPGDVLESLSHVVRRHALAALRPRNAMRVLVVTPNAGTVSFEAVDGDVVVRHCVFSQALDDSQVGAGNTLHAASIRPPAGDPGPQLRTDES
jgi:hypothetical protein